MPASKQLNTWIAESGSWQSFIDFKLPEDERARYPFLSQYDNFYLSLMSRTFELLKADNNDELTSEFLAIAKGLEIFSLYEKRNNFEGVNHSDNILYSSGLYYLANYPASAWILSKLYSKKNYSKRIDRFISGFLSRDLSGSNTFTLTFKRFLEYGNLRLLKFLIYNISKIKSNIFEKDIDKYFAYLLTETILKKFYKDNIWSDLLSINNDVDYWRDYVIKNIEKKFPVWSFFPSQKEAIRKGVLEEKTFSLQMPTSSGKTSISELIIYNEFKKKSDCHILYLAPYRALAAELKQTLAISLSDLGITSKTIYGGNLPSLEERNSIRDVNLLISTPEKFMAIENIFPGISDNFTTIICDEGQLLDDESRGLSYELLLSRLKSNRAVQRRFIFVSAIIPNISIINSWLGGDDDSLISSEYRPTELEYAFLRKMGTINGYYLDVNPHKKRPYNYQLYKYLIDDELKIKLTRKKTKKITSKKGISVAVSIKATGSGTVALFAPHKRGHSGVEGLAEEALINLNHSKDEGLQKYSPEGYLDSLVEYFSIVFGSNYLLTKCAQIGVLFHHGDFPQSIRELVEDSIRENYVRLVICTNTLAEGVNLPIKTIVLHSTIRYNPLVYGNYSPLKIRDLKNLVGRAGRAGKETKGIVIVPHETDFKIINDLILEKNIEPVKGQLYNIVQLITNHLKILRLQIDEKTLDGLTEQIQELVDEVDTSLIDLLASEVNSDELSVLVNQLIAQTLSFYQSSSSEKHTLTTLFSLRSKKIKPIIESGDFNILKNSGANIRLFEEINEKIDFNDDRWNNEFDAADRSWIKFILDEGVFQMERFMTALTLFNNDNSCELETNEIKKAIKLWLKGSWYSELSSELNIEMYQVLRLVNSLISYNIQNIVSSIIRIKELKFPDYSLPINIANWPSYLQYGIDSPLKLSLIEMGLNDRVAVLSVSNYLVQNNYNYVDYNHLKSYMNSNVIEITESLNSQIPVIAYYKLKTFAQRLDYKNIY